MKVTESKATVRGKYEVNSKSGYLLLTVLTLLYAVNYMDRQVLTVVIEPLKHTLDINDGQAGMLHTLFLLSVGILSIPAGILTDRWSRRKTIGLMAILWSIATLGTGLSKSYPQIVFARILTGIGEAGFMAGGMAWLALSFSGEKRSKVIGIFNVGIPLGSMLGVVVGGIIATRSGSWRVPFFCFAVPGIILGIITFFMKDYATIKLETGKDLVRSFFTDGLSILKIRTFVFDTLGISFMTFIAIGFLTWTPALFMRFYGFTEAKAGAVMGLFAVTGILAAPAGGYAADIWQKKNRRGRMLLPMISGLLAMLCSIGFMLVIHRSFEMALLIGAMSGFFTMLGMPAMLSVLQDIIDPRLKSTAMGIHVVLMFVCGGAWGPVTVGFLSDFMGGGASGLRQALFTVSFAGILSVICLFLGSRYYPMDSDKIKDEVMAE